MHRACPGGKIIAMTETPAETATPTNPRTVADHRDHAREEATVQTLTEDLTAWLLAQGCTGLEIVGETANGGAVIEATAPDATPLSLSINATP